MKTYLKLLLLAMLACTIGFTSCQKAEYSFGLLKAPSNLQLSATVQGAGAASPAGDGSGNILVSVSATNAITYKFYFGNGDSLLSPSGKASYQYTTLDTNQYVLTVNAIGTGGAITTLSKQLTVLYKYQIPAAIMQQLTGGTAKKWKIANDTIGNIGVGPATSFTPDWYTAAPNEKPACAYTSVITFTQAGTNGVTINDNNMGSTFLIDGASSFYGQSGGAGCYALNTGGTKTLGFSVAHSGSTAASSTGIQFNVPGDGLVGFGTGGSTYEIISLSSTVMVLRNIGFDGNAWYQILRVSN